MPADHAVQNGDISNSDELKGWVDRTVSEFKERGAQLCRLTQHPVQRNIYLMEGWDNPRADQGEPEFFVTS